MSTLRKSEICPIHRSRFCCGREERKAVARKVERHGPVTRLPDGREECTPAEMRRRKLIKVREQDNICGCGCGQVFIDYRYVDLHHIKPKGMGSGSRDDSMSNLVALEHEHHMEVHAGNRVIA